MDDGAIIALYFDRNERALIETKTKYGGYIRFIAASILDDEGDVEECENDVYFALWKRIPPNRPDDLRPYIGSVCRRIALFRRNKDLAEKRGGGKSEAAYEELSEILSGGGEDAADTIALRDALDAFLRGLSKEARIIFLQKYWYLRSLAEIAEDRAMSENAVKASLFRTREKLKKHLKKEGFEL